MKPRRWKGFDSFNCRMEESNLEFEFLLVSLARLTSSGVVASVFGWVKC